MGFSYPATPLSQREINILPLKTMGLSRKETAERLYISELTAKVHLRNICQKLGVNSKVGAIKLARNRGYLSIAETQGILCFYIDELKKSGTMPIKHYPASL